MTKREGAIITAYTGIMCCKEFGEFHKYAEEIMERPVFTHEFANKDLFALLKQKSEADFMSIIRNQIEP